METMESKLTVTLEHERQKFELEFDLNAEHGRAWQRFRDRNGKEFAGVTVYWWHWKRDALQCVVELSNGALDEQRQWCGDVYFDRWVAQLQQGNARPIIAGQNGDQAQFIDQRAHALYFRSGKYISQEPISPPGRDFGPQNIDSRHFHAFPREEAVASMRSKLSHRLSQNPRYGIYRPWGSLDGNEAGGEDVAFFSPIDLMPHEDWTDLRFLVARRVAHKTDTLALRGEDGLALLPADLANPRTGRLEFDMHANTLDNGRIPHFHATYPNPTSGGSCDYRAEFLAKVRQNDPEHYSRSIIGLQGLVAYLDPRDARSQWARETLYRRMAHLRMWKPEIRGKGVTMHALAQNGNPGTFDRDEGWMLHLAGVCYWAATKALAAGAENAADLHYLDNCDAWNTTLAQAAVRAADPETGYHQGRTDSERHWSSDPSVPDKDGNHVPKNHKAAYNFQEAIIIGGIRSLVMSGALDFDAPTRAALGDTARLAAATMFHGPIVRSSSFEVTGKQGPPDIVSVENMDRFHWGAASIVNTTLAAVESNYPIHNGASLLGATSTEGALAIIENDTVHGYSGSLSFSAPLAELWLDRDNPQPDPPREEPTRPEEPEPQQPVRPEEDADERDELPTLAEMRRLAAQSIREMRTLKKALDTWAEWVERPN